MAGADDAVIGADDAVMLDHRGFVAETGDGGIGPVTKQLTKLYANLTAAAGTVVA